MPDDEDFDPDERFSLFPKAAEDVLETLLGTKREDADDSPDGENS